MNAIPFLCIILVLSMTSAMAIQDESTGKDSSEDNATEANHDDQADIEQNTESDKPKPTKAKVETPLIIAERTWKKDSATILALLTKVRKLKHSGNLSEVQMEKKAEQIAAELKKLNTEIAEKPLKLDRVMVKQVTAESQTTEKGLKRKKAFFRELRKTKEGRMMLKMAGDPPERNFAIALLLAQYMQSCKNCTARTGRYIAEFEIPVPSRYEGSENDSIYSETTNGLFAKPSDGADSNSEGDYEQNTISVKIYRLITEEADALKLQIGTRIPLNAKIFSIHYEYADGREQITLYLF